jgi:hypothetical protein
LQFIEPLLVGLQPQAFRVDRSVSHHIVRHKSTMQDAPDIDRARSSEEIGAGGTDRSERRLGGEAGRRLYHRTGGDVVADPGRAAPLDHVSGDFHLGCQGAEAADRGRIGPLIMAIAGGAPIVV